MRPEVASTRPSVDSIAAEAGVSKMTIYSNFGSKGGLFEAVLQDRADRVMGGSAGVEALDLGDGHIRGLLMLDMPDAREGRALLREAARVFMAAYEVAG